ncbi:hypothetical protein DFR30_2582 [Thiogranum longum]|uniref:DUF5658 domain-containing protein n=1 Tax=Thiogranum longum TaxID=1537524 RepID=A0A4R1HPQ2_9GAMM|nr:DUF5658 family protein [Thiogranum longum]TCK19272.1 hypothetical protein DFR30_2582 [Thiogranum longum]
MPSGNTATALNSQSRAEERRDQLDRRRHSWRTVTYCGLHGRGRRRHARREGHNYYLDWYDPRLVMTGLGIVLLSCLDALLTLTLLNRGAYEANQFMAQLMEIGIGTFVATKIAITCIGILFLLMHSHFRILKVTSGKQVLKLLLSVYGVLILYEAVLLGVME